MAINAQFPKPLECLFTPKRYKVLYGGRGAGRSWGCARALLIKGTQAPLRVLCAREFQKSIAESVHKLLSDHIMELGLGNFYDILKTEITGKNGTIFTFAGIKNNVRQIKSYEGIDVCWVEEANNVSKSSWEILIPTVRKNGSEIWLTFNPELETDYTYQRFVVDEGAKNNQFTETPRSFVVKMTYEDNPWLPPSLLEEMLYMKEHDYDAYLNIWMGFTRQTLEGAIYANELRKAQESGRICTVPYDSSVPVDVSWDLGRADNTALWFFQRVAMQWRLLGYYEESGEDITHFLKELQRRGYIYGTMHLPHDAKAKRLGSKLSIEEVIRQAGFKTHIVPKLSVADGINAARMVFPNCWFDAEGCTDGISALRHYRYAIKDGQRLNDPLHDWASDGADAFRYFAISSHLGRSTPAGALLERLGFNKPKSLTIDSSRGRGGSVPDGMRWLG
jgi:phage terminase large subunit